MSIQTVATPVAVALRAYRALCRKHLAPPRAERANPRPCNPLTEHRDDAHLPRPGRP